MTSRAAPLVALMGATATGKSALAMALARHHPFEIVSVDSVQVYRGMDIGSAKPDASMREAVRHHLVDVADPSEAYSAARFRSDALCAIEDIRSRGRWPLLVGGTRLYFRALLQGLSRLPSARPELRRSLAAEAARDGWPALHARLAALDPPTAARLHPNDAQRIQRALEIAAVTGTPPSRLQEGGDAAPTPAVLRIVATVPERAELHRRIQDRFGQMMAAGLLDEVRRLHQRGDLDASKPAVRAVGYRQLWAHLDGECDLASARDAGIAATRRLARRQLTWLRAEPDTWPVDAADSGAVARAAERLATVLGEAAC